MDALILTSMALALLFLLGLFWHSRNHVRQSFPGRQSAAEPAAAATGAAWPRAALIVPLTGNSPQMRASLQSLLSQDYPDLEVILVTREAGDPATSLVQELLPGHARARHVLSGPATTCSQKNHNLLAGLALLDDGVEILAFCDSTHQAPPDLLRRLIRPLAAGEAVLTTGFHRVLARDLGLATLKMQQIILALQLIHGIAWVVQPWGGATAIRRRVFEAHGIRRLWSQTVVDDVTMAAHLRRQGIRVKAVPTAILTTPLAGQSAADLEAWLIRQLLYLKYCVPGTWLAAAPLAYLLTAPPLMAAAAGLGWLLGLVPASGALAGVAFLGLLAGLAACYRTLVPQRLPLGPWLRAYYGTLWLAGVSYFKTWATDTIAWRGISYRVSWGGQVREIRDTRPRPEP
jgi:ceramide glucosyltransferase